MGSIFSPPPPVVVSTPYQSASTGSTEIKPYAPVVPYIQNLLPSIQQTFTESPQLYTGSLVPATTAAQQQAQQMYMDLAQSVAPGLTAATQAGFGGLLQTALTPAEQSQLYQTQVGTIAQQARQMTERDKLQAQQQAIDAGQYGLGSTALGELETRQQQARQEAAQTAMSQAYQAAEAQRMSALSSIPGYAQNVMAAAITPASLYEAVGAQQQAQQQAELSDAARLAQQQQEAKRAQLVTLSNLFGGLAGLGSSTQMQQTTSGYGSQAFGGGPSPFMQMAQAAGTIGSMFAKPSASDIRLKTDIKRVGKLPNGLNVYTWEWNEEGKRVAKDQPTMGVIAQEVLEVLPEAVTKGSDGYLLVNYGKVLEEDALRGDN